MTAAALDCANAQPIEPPQPRYGWQEVWTGADATRDVWLLYSGVTLAPWSEHIYADGLRLRTSGGYGRYSYLGAVSSCVAPNFGCAYVSKRFNVEHSYVDALVGYHKRFGELTAKAFIGVSSITHRFDVNDPDNDVAGDDFGVKGVIELWLNLGPKAWTSLDLAYTTAHETGSARWRAGWRMLPTVSLGPEVRYDTNAHGAREGGWTGRAGVFVRYEWFGGEISAAGGVDKTFTVDDELGLAALEDLAAYGTVNLLLQF